MKRARLQGKALLTFVVFTTLTPSFVACDPKKPSNAAASEAMPAGSAALLVDGIESIPYEEPEMRFQEQPS